MKATPVNSLSVLFLLLLQVQQAQGFFFCEIFGFLTGLGAGPVRDGLNSLLPQGYDLDASLPYTRLEFTSFREVDISGCDTEFGAVVSMLGDPAFELIQGTGVTINVADLRGEATVSSTFDFFGFLFGGFKVCFNDIKFDVTLVDLPTEFQSFQNDLETAFVDSINAILPNPACFN